MSLNQSFISDFTAKNVTKEMKVLKKQHYIYDEL